MQMVVRRFVRWRALRRMPKFLRHEWGRVSLGVVLVLVALALFS